MEDYPLNNACNNSSGVVVQYDSQLEKSLKELKDLDLVSQMVHQMARRTKQFFIFINGADSTSSILHKDVRLRVYWSDQTPHSV
jgi:hypothetical protein